MNLKTLILPLLILVTSFSCKNNERALVVGRVQKASKLATCKFTVDKIVHGTKTKRLAWFIKLNEARFLAYSQAFITTGVNLDKLKTSDVVIDGKIISITLPPIEVLNFSYPPDKFRIDNKISDPEKFLNRISIDDQEEYFREAEMDIRNNLEYMDIVKTTQQKTINMLTGMLSIMGYDEIHILFSSDSLIVDKVKTEINK